MKFSLSWTPDNIRHNLGSKFVGLKYQANDSEAGVICRPFGIKGPNAMSFGERKHASLRKNFLKSRKTYKMPPSSTEIEIK